ncbi:DUF7344 domain-containing protein [Halosimplex salinum]|uniref:DUF7344 domain-containing protein n=1 Tax=Halosimplex salinum TaxID=1710538 RepID=UPI000F4AF0EC|nr:hypothetical protein [Halosimplex salinum]
MSQTTDESTDRDGTVADLTADERYDLLAADRRRLTLAALSELGAPADLEDVAAEVAARESDEDSPPTAVVDRVAVSLHHVHLPRMADLDVVDYDTVSNRIEAVRATSTLSI